MKSLDARLLALEAAVKSLLPYPYPWPLPPGKQHMAVLVMDGPTAQAELTSWRSKGYVAELESESTLQFIG